MCSTMAEVKLLGFWSSPFSNRVKLALKLKGVEFEYIEEDLPNKSDLLLELNPVHKKVPVLVHNGKAVAESLVILDYIEETWPGPPLLPKDPYDRAMARFWILFLVDESQKFREWMIATGTQKSAEAAEEARRVLATVEEKALGDREFFGGESVNMVDVVYVVIAHWIPAAEKLQGSEILLDPTALPRLSAWASRLRRLPVIGENLPGFDKLVDYLGGLREKILLRR